MSTKKKIEISNDLPVLLDSVYCLHRSGDHDAAAAVLTDCQKSLDEEHELKHVPGVLKLIGDYYQNILSTQHFTTLKSIENYILKLDVPLFCGWVHFLQGYFLKQEDALKKAVQAFKQGEHYQEMIEVYYWMDKFRCLPMDEKVHSFVRLYPVDSVFSFLMGNNFFGNAIEPKTAVERIQINSYDHSEEDFDCWLVKNKAFIPSHYKDVHLDEDNFLDLYSGLINDRGEFSYLLISELNCLSYLIASQLIGASLQSIAEFLGRTVEEAKALVNSLVKMGIPIEQDNDLFRLNWSAKPTMIVPRTLKVLGLQEFVKKKKKQFTKAQLIELLQLTQFGAEALLKKWALAGFIRPSEGPDRVTVWKFV